MYLFFCQSVYIDDTDDEQTHNGSPNLEHMAKVSKKRFIFSFKILSLQKYIRILIMPVSKIIQIVPLH